MRLEDDGQSIELEPFSIRKEYLARLQRFLTEVRRACGEAGCDYVPITTDKPIGEALANYLRKRAAT